MIAIRPLSHFDPAGFVALASGYTAVAIYRVARTESDAETTLRLTLEPLPAPREFGFPYHADELRHYAECVPGPFCLGAYDGERLVAIALGEERAWNRSLWVGEFHVDAAYRRQGIGRRLMDEVARRGQAAGLRALVLETQNTNVDAIRFYRAAGLTLDGINVSHYTNDDLGPDGAVAVFMTRRLE
ncbi:MAG TPA: GNAT family N-acetyltransferase [Promineifilum sp.]|nr:GNAT family N-acetyltransferase [Promineifilum sp.]